MDLSKKLVNITKRLGKHYTLKGRPLSHTEVCSDVGLLPGLTKRADQLASLCLGYNLGASYEDTEQTLMGVKVTFNETIPNTLRLFCITDVLCELIRSSPDPDSIALDELLYD